MKTLTLIAAILFAPVAYAQTKTTDTTKSGTATGTTSGSTTTTSKGASNATGTSGTMSGTPAKTGMVGTAGTSGTAQAGAGAPTTTATDKVAKPGKLAQNELQVLAHFHAVNQMEIDLGKTAKRLAKSDGVKQYGEMLVKDHTDADKQLTALAKKRGQMIPVEKPMNDVEKQEKADAKTAVMKLKKLKGAEFDTAFLAEMVAGHEKELAKADAKLAEIQDSEVADTLRGLKPTLQMHADHARELQNDMTGNASMETPAPTPSTGTSAKR